MEKADRKHGKHQHLFSAPQHNDRGHWVRPYQPLQHDPTTIHAHVCPSLLTSPVAAAAAIVFLERPNGMIGAATSYPRSCDGRAAGDGTAGCAVP
eukprot:353182-Chlamydomonas_euryale.AAC.25